MLDLYKNIKKRREELKITQAQLAELTGYADKTMISKIENGLIDLPQSKIAVMADALRTTPRILMGWEDDDESQEYYLDPETARMAQELLDSPGQRMLLDATRDLRPEDMDMLIRMAKALRNDQSEDN